MAAKMRYSSKHGDVFVATFLIVVKSEFVLIVHLYRMSNMQFVGLTPIYMDFSCLTFRDL